MRKNSPGWYDDPVDDARFRWWTGDAWSSETSVDLRTPPPASMVPLVRRSRLRTAGKVAAWIFAALVLLACVGALAEAIYPTADLECWRVEAEVGSGDPYDSLYGCREVP